MFVRLASVALLVVALSAVLFMRFRRSGRHRRHHRTAAHPGHRRRRLAGRYLHDGHSQMLSGDAESQFFRKAGGHPPVGFTNYIIQHVEGIGKVEPAGIPIPTSELKPPEAEREIKTLRVDLPPGPHRQPERRPRSARSRTSNSSNGFHKPKCAEATIVGKEEVTLVTTLGGVVPAPSPPFPAANTLPKGTVIAPDPLKGTVVPVYNLEPERRRTGPLRLRHRRQRGGLPDDRSRRGRATSTSPSRSTRRPPAPPVATLVSRLVNFGKSTGNGTYITNPTTCFDPEEASTANLYSTYFRAESYRRRRPDLPDRLDPDRLAAAGGDQAERLPEHPLRPVDRSRTGDDRSRLARRRRR